jgi:hypothetical protein
MEAKEGLGAEEPRSAEATSPVAAEKKGEEKKGEEKKGLLGDFFGLVGKVGKKSKKAARKIRHSHAQKDQHKPPAHPHTITTQMHGTSLAAQPKIAPQQPVAEPKRGGRRRKTRSKGKRRKTRRGGKSIRRRSRRRSQRRRGTSYKIR